MDKNVWDDVDDVDLGGLDLHFRVRMAVYEVVVCGVEYIVGQRTNRSMNEVLYSDISEEEKSRRLEKVLNSSILDGRPVYKRCRGIDNSVQNTDNQ